MSILVVRAPGAPRRTPPAIVDASLLHCDVRIAGRTAELVERPLRHVWRDDVSGQGPQVRHPRDDGPRQVLIDVLVAGETRLADQSRALVELRVDARDVRAVAGDLQRLALRRRDP